MTSRIIAPMIMGLAIFATPAIAAAAAGTTGDENTRMNAPMTPPEECHYLQNKFDSWIQAHADVQKTPQARKLRNNGESLCKAGNTEKGIKDLKQALNDINVPTVED